MAKSLMIQGTTSNAGKSLTVAGLCRILKEDGYKVAPFKSQNLSLNSYITDNGLEMGRAQVVQAEACGIKPDIRMNPILLKPSSNGLQIIFNGKVLPKNKAKNLFEDRKKLMEEIMKSYNSLAKDYDVIILEGAGSPAEINLKSTDVVNMNMAKASNSPVIIVGDIDRGGVFASLYGTLMLLEKDELSLVKGLLINKFRGDISLLKPALNLFKKYSNIPFTGIIPYIDVNIDEEDILTTCSYPQNNVTGIIDIVILKLPKISNFTDFNIFKLIKNVNVRYVEYTKDFGTPDLLILPGTKSTISDLLWLRKMGFEKLILDHSNKNKPIIGICGGFQMLCKSITDNNNVEYDGTVKGLGLLDYDTYFKPEKIRTNQNGKLDTIGGIFKDISCLGYEGYEIHMGTSNTDKNIVNNKNVYGTYIHGIFDKKKITETIIKALVNEKNLTLTNSFDKIIDYKDYKEEQYTILANELRKAINMDKIYDILNKGISLK